MTAMRRRRARAGFPGIGNDRGFTMTELMVVVIIVGILAAVALPAFGRYTRKSHTAEAIATIEKLVVGSVAYYEADHVTSAGVLVSRQFPGNPGTLTEPDCCSYPAQRCPAAQSFFQADPLWAALTYGTDREHRYSASYYMASYTDIMPGTYGDLDCDGTLSTFGRRVSVLSTSERSPRITEALYIVNEIE